jgi:hypothetical protein
MSDNRVQAEIVEVGQPQPQSSRLITGWLSERFECGEMPCYGYPKNHLPDVPKAELTIAPSFSTKAK